MKKLLLFAMAIIFAMQLSAQTMVVVGDSTTSTTSAYVPMYMNYENSFTESLYPANLLMPGEISSITYYVSENAYTEGTMKIYMKEVTESSLSDFIVGNDFTEVYNGPAAWVVGSNTFTFTTPFMYTGLGNLLVAVIRDGNNYSSYPRFRHVNVGSSVYEYDDYEEFNINTPIYGSLISSVPVVRFEITLPEGFCFPPTNVTCDNTTITSSEATISWDVMDESSTTFGLAYRAVGTEEWETASETISDVTYTLTNLDAYTEYEVKVWGICGENVSTEITTTFMTLPTEDNFITLPYDENFDDLESLTYWRFKNPAVNKWHVGPVGHNATAEDAAEEGNGLYISNDGGLTNAYTQATAVAHASVLINIEEATRYAIAFDWKNNAENCCDYVAVSMVPFSEGLGSTLNSSYVYAKAQNTSNQWERKTVEFPDTITPGQYFLALTWRNDSFGGENPPASLDNVSIYSPACTALSLYPDVEYAATEDGPSLVVSLIDSANTDVTYAIQYKANADSVWTTITDLTIDEFPYSIAEEIEYQTQYTVQVGVVCSGEDVVNLVAPMYITTPCAVLETPWIEDFSTTPFGSLSCWNRYNTALPASGQINAEQLSTTTSGWNWTLNSSESYQTLGGEVQRAIHANIYSTYKYWAVSPSINLTGDEVQQISFSVGARKYASDVAPTAAPDDRFIVMVSLDNGATWNSANGIIFADGDSDTEHNFSNLTNQYQRYSYKLVDENEEPLIGTVRFAFYAESTQGNGDNWIFVDDIAVENYVDCVAPYGVSVSPASITSTSATASFSNYGDATTWEYVLVEGADADPNSGEAIEVSTTDAVELTDLTPETVYTFAVRAICESGESEWTTTTFVTLAEPEELPYETTFDDGMWFVNNVSGTANTWVVGEGTGNEAPAAYISNDGSAYAATLVDEVTITHLWKDFDFGQTEDDFELLFDWKVTGRQEGTDVYGGIAVYIVEPTPLPATGLLSNSNIVSIVTGSDEWQNERVYLGNITGEKRLVFTALGYADNSELAVPAAIDNVSLIVTPCSQVENVVLSNPTTSTIDVAWTSTGADSYVISYRAEGSEEIETATTADTTYTIEGLTSMTKYYVAVSGVCGSDESVMSATQTIVTRQEPVEIPYTCDFEEEGNNGWFINNGTSVNKWYVGTPTGATSRELYMSSTNGTTAGYSTSSPTVIVAEKLFQLGATDSVKISFDLKVGGETGWDYLKVYWVPVDTVYEATTDYSVYYGSSSYSNGVIMSNYSSGHLVHLTSGTQNMSVTLPNNHNQLRKLVFVWRCDGGGGNGQGAIIDNIMIEEIGEEVTCFPPIENSLTATGVTETSATLTWEISDDSQSAWNVYYRATGTEEWSMIPVTEPTVELTDLSPDTQYTVYVTTDCGDEESAQSTQLTFRTQCVALTVPLIEDFTTNVLNSSCWSKAKGLLSNNTTLTNSDDVDWYHSTNTVDGDATGKMKLNLYYDDKRDWFISPLIDLGEDGTLYELSAKVACADYYEPTLPATVQDDDKFAIVVSTDGGETWSSANAVIFAEGDSDTDHNLSSLSPSFTRVTYLLQDAEGNPLTGLIKVGFYAETTVSGSDYNIFVDDFSIAEPTSCAEPVSNSVVVSGITETSATVSWTDNDESHSAWNVYYKATSETEWTMIPATETSVELPDLVASTAYSVYVTTNCGEEESFPTSTVGFNTPCGTIVSFPYVEGFEGLDWGCWTTETIAGTSWALPDMWNILSAADADGIFTPIGQQSAYHTYETGASGRLVSPVFDLSELTNPYLKFDYQRIEDGGSVEGLTVQYRTGADATWTELAVMNGTPDQWITDSIALPAETYQVAFVSLGVYGYGVALDNVTVYDADGEGGSTDPDPEPEPCDAPTALSANNITETTAEITWNGTATTYEFKLNGGTAETLTTTTKALTGLTPATAYTVEVRAVCEDAESDWVTTTFTTLQEQGGEDPEPEPCDAPTNLSANNITETSAEITWNGTASTYEFKLNGGTAETLTTTTKALTGLTPNTAYTVEVRSICENQTSEWVSANFTTLEQIVIVLGEVTTSPATNLGNTSATLNGALVSAGESENYTIGFALATVADFTLEDANVQNITATLTEATFTATVNDLVEGQTYFYRAYITNEAGTAYGTVETFTLLGLTDALANQIAVSLYPNPASDNATLDINGLNQDAKIVISDLQGRILSQDNINAGTTRYTINVSDMTSGVYYIRIITDNVVSTQKLIVE